MFDPPDLVFEFSTLLYAKRPLDLSGEAQQFSQDPTNFLSRFKSSKRISSLNRSFFSGLCFLLATMTCVAQSNVVTYQYDNSRSGQNTNETTLTPSNVNMNQFGKLFSLPVDGQVYAQPLYVPGVAISGKGTHNVLIVATENDSVYAFDADLSASPLWQVSLVDTAHGGNAGCPPQQVCETALNTSTTFGCSDLQPSIGITSTPVIDSSSGTIYVEAKSVDGPNYFHRLHALDIATGNEKSPGPVQIKATVNGTGDGSTSPPNSQLVFDSNNMALHQLNRPGLLLMNGTIFLGFASHCDSFPYHGWLFAYDAATFTQKGVFVTTPNGGLGGFWMSGAGPAGDANGNIYAATGNGTFSQGAPLELGDSILKLNFNGTLSLADYFTPFNQNGLNSGDTDVGSGGVLLLPDQPGNHPHLLLEAGKEGRIYLIDRDKLTANPSNPSQELPFCSGCSSDPQIVQESGSGQVGGMWSMPAYWNNTTYWWGSYDVLKSIPLSTGQLDFTHITSSTEFYNFPGATPSISANGTSNGIVWSIDSSQYGSPGPGPGPAVLHAHDATNVSRGLWNSTQAANNRDRAGNAVKFSVPRIANGKVYIGTSTEVDVYGLLSLTQAATPAISPAPGTYTNSVTVTITDTTANATITYTTDGSTPVPGSHGTAISSGGSFTLTSSATVQAIASASGFSNSSIASATYTVFITPGTGILLIQRGTFSRQPTSGGTVTLTLPQATGAGHSLIVGVSFWPLDITSVTDGSGDAFARGLGTSVYHNVNRSATYTNFYYAKSTAGGTTSLTLNFSGGSTYLLVAVAEVAGLNPSAPPDQSGFQESLTATAAWSSAAVTTTAANEYLFSWAASEAGSVTCSSPASGWTIESQTNPATVCLLDRVVSATGSYQASVTPSTAQNYAMELATFRGNAPSGPPLTPTGLTATAGNAQVSLAWNASTGAASYNLYRSVNGGAYSQLNTSPITMTSYTDSSLTNGTPYCYEATAVNSSGESVNKSSPACATPQPPPPPPTPTGLTATAGNAQVSLAWNASTGAASYNLYRSVNGGAYSQLNTSPITMTSYTDSSLTNGTPYCYEATAVNSFGESVNKSSPACATPQPSPPPPAISLIQKATFSRQPTSGGTLTLTLPQATGVGHALIVGLSFWPLDITSVTDGSGDAFARGLGTSVYHNVNRSATYTNFYYAKSTAGGTTSLTLNFSGGSTYLLVAVAEVAGLNPSAPPDQSGFQESLTATAAWSSAAVTTTAANEYLFSWAASEAGSVTCSSPASGWTIESQTNPATVCLLDRVVSATGSYQASVTPSTAQNYAMEIVTFK